MLYCYFLFKAWLVKLALIIQIIFIIKNISVGPPIERHLPYNLHHISIFFIKKNMGTWKNHFLLFNSYSRKIRIYPWNFFIFFLFTFLNHALRSPPFATFRNYSQHPIIRLKKCKNQGCVHLCVRHVIPIEFSWLWVDGNCDWCRSRGKMNSRV